MRKRCLVSHSDGRGWFVDLPSYRMVAGSFLPVVAGVIGEDGPLLKAGVAEVLGLGCSVVCELPEDFPLLVDGKADSSELGRRYLGSAWASASDQSERGDVVVVVA